MPSTPDPDAPALNPDGTLKDASELEFFNSPSDKIPIPRMATGGESDSDAEKSVAAGTSNKRKVDQTKFMDALRREKRTAAAKASSDEDETAEPKTKTAKKGAPKAKKPTAAAKKKADQAKKVKAAKDKDLAKVNKEVLQQNAAPTTTGSQPSAPNVQPHPPKNATINANKDVVDEKGQKDVIDIESDSDDSEPHIQKAQRGKDVQASFVSATKEVDGKERSGVICIFCRSV
jgi:hypothetical protein